MMRFLKKLKSNAKSYFLCALIFPPGTVIVSWNPNTEADLKGYRLYYGNASRNYQSQQDVGNVTQVTIPGLSENVPYYFAVTAYDTAGNESAYSKEVFVILNPTDTGGTDTVRVNLNSYNFPNPFTAGEQVTNLRYILPEPSEVSITVFDVRNSVVKTILNGELKTAGEHTEDAWDGRDELGNVVANGDYFCEVKTASYRHYIKITVLN